MLMTIDSRKKKLKFLRRTRYDSFTKVCQELGITYTFPPEYYRRVTRRWLAKKAFCNKVTFSAPNVICRVQGLCLTHCFLPLRSLKRCRNKKPSRERNREQLRLRKRSQHPLQNHKELPFRDLRPARNLCWQVQKNNLICPLLIHMWHSKKNETETSWSASDYLYYCFSMVKHANFSEVCYSCTK